MKLMDQARLIDVNGNKAHFLEKLLTLEPEYLFN